MHLLDKPFGEVNTRYTCCTYLALTGAYPDYCQRFEFGEGLVSYCKKDHQGYGVSYDRDRLRIDNAHPDAKYVLVPQPATLVMDLSAQTYMYESALGGGTPKVYKRRRFMGDYADLDDAIHENA